MKTLYLALALALTACITEQEQTEQLIPAVPGPGSPGLGDSLFPGLGNGGYDVQHYRVELAYGVGGSEVASAPVLGRMVIVAKAVIPLSQFNLDFAGDSVVRVEVGYNTAAYSRTGAELVIVPANPITAGTHFVAVVHFSSTPGATPSAPFFTSPDGTAWAPQPDGAHRIFPCNDHPSDKATWTFGINVPAGITAVANGQLASTTTSGDRTTWWYSSDAPMATELAQLAVGEFDVIERGFVDGVRVRDVVPTRLAAELEPALAGVSGHLPWLTAQLGPYPFQTYGSLVVDAPLGYALETQTLSIFDGSFIAGPPEDYEWLMVHELAHQWFGNSVSPARWTDIWMSEGHATWYDLLYYYGSGADFIEVMRQTYAYGDGYRAAWGPVGSPSVANLYSPQVYFGGALVLFALRQQIGAAASNALERAWVTEMRGKSVTTADFIAFVAARHGAGIKTFLNAWIYGTTTPPMPGYPSWTVDPYPFAPLAMPLPEARGHQRFHGSRP